MKKLFSFNILFVLILACTCFLAETCEEMFDDDDDDDQKIEEVEQVEEEG